MMAGVAAFLWGTIGIAYSLGLRGGCRWDWLVAGRVIVASLGGVIGYLAGLGRPSRWSVIIGLGALAPLYIVYLMAIPRIGAAMASILLYTAPIWVALLSPVLLGERPGRSGYLGVALGFLGVVLVGYQQGDADIFGILLGLASGVSYGLYILLARLAQLRGASSLEVGLYAIPFSALGVLLVLRPDTLPGGCEVYWSLYLGVVATLLPYVLHTKALSMVEAYRVSIVSLVEPLSATILAYIVLGERLTLLQAVGGLLILSASYTVVREGWT